MPSESRRSNRTRGGIAALAGVALLALALVACGGDAEPQATPPADAPREIGLIDGFRPEVGEPAPDFALADARDPDRIVRLSDYRGTPVVLNWFASWCAPCRAEIPDFQAAAAALEGQVVFLGVNLQESPADAVAMLDELGATYPALLDADGAIAAHYRLLGMPSTYFIDADGVIVSSGAGIIVEQALVEELARLGLDYTPPREP